MTAAARRPLVDRVKAALHVYVARGDRINAAQAALDACHAEDMLAAIRELISAMPDSDGETDFFERYDSACEKAEALLAKLDGRP